MAEPDRRRIIDDIDTLSIIVDILHALTALGRAQAVQARLSPTKETVSHVDEFEKAFRRASDKVSVLLDKLEKANE